MSTRRRIGISIATSEAARRQLMQPVPCWEKMWVLPENAPPGSTFKVYKWVKTDKRQQFSDDEGALDEPLAPLPDEPEIVEGDEEMEQDEATQSVAPDVTSREATEPVVLKDELPSKVTTPKPHPLSISFQPDSAAESTADDTLDSSLKALDGTLESGVGVTDALNTEDLPDLDMAELGPDGTAFEGAHDLTQMQETDTLLGGEMMDSNIGTDPFAGEST